MRKIFTISFITVCALIFSFQTRAQQNRSHYNLLWKISGNGLKKPSYLFGTMHLQDKRVFDFSDSVLVKLDECPAFAMELLPDSIIKAMFTQMFSPDTTNNLQKNLSKEEYEMLDKRLQEEAGVSIDKLQSKEPWMINMLLDKPVNIPRKGDKATFLDAYLYRLAKQGDKKLIGLEKLEEQTSQIYDYSSLKEDVKVIRTKLSNSYEAKSLEELIKMYWEGDVEKLYARIHQSGANENYYYKMLTVRNKTMADRLVKYIREQATFIAVGAAHLPGDDGLIKLLAKQGFTVSPVKATFTGMAARYKEKESQAKWYTFTSKESAYSIDMPSEPFPYAQEGVENSGMKMYVLPDLEKGLTYFTSAMPIPLQLDASKQEELFKQSISGMAKRNNSKLISEKKITFDNYPGREVEILEGKNSQHLRCRIYLRKNNMYLFMVGGTKELIYAKEATQFFNSFRFQNFEQSNWHDFTDPSAAFKIKTPVKLIKQKQEFDIENQKGVKMLQTYFSGTDQQKGISYLALCSDFSAGFVIQNDSLYLNNLISSALEMSKGKIEEERAINLQKFPGKAFTIRAEDMMYYSRYYLKGGRLYYLIVTTPSAEEAIKTDAEAFLNSFSFTDFVKPNWQEYKSTNGHFTIKVPGKVTIDTLSNYLYQSQLQVIRHSSSDANSGLSYVVTQNKYSDYYEAKDEESYFKELIKGSTSKKDSLLKETTLRIDGQPARETIVQMPGTHALKRTRMVLQGNTLYEMAVYVPEESVNALTTNTFFDSFHFTKQPILGNLFTKKAEKFFHDLASPDTLTHKSARKALPNFTFTKQDLPALYKAIQHTYSDDTVSYRNTKSLLIGSLREVNDSTTLPFLRKLYTGLTEDQDKVRLVCLQVMTRINSEESLTLFTDLILAKTPQAAHNQFFFYSLRDSLQPSRVMYPRIMQLTSQPHFASSIIWHTNILCDSSIIQAKDIAAYVPQIIADGQKSWSKYQQSKKEAYQEVYYLEAIAKFLSYFPENAEGTKLLTQMMISSHESLVLEAMSTLLEHNKPVNKKVIGSLAAKSDFRLALYNRLVENKRLDLFPSKYLTQEFFAESTLLSYLADDEDGSRPDKIVLLEARETEIEGKRGRIYLYKFMYKPIEKEEESWYVGVSGLQPIDPKQVATTTDYANTQWHELKEKSLEEHFKELTAIPAAKIE